MIRRHKFKKDSLPSAGRGTVGGGGPSSAPEDGPCPPVSHSLHPTPCTLRPTPNTHTLHPTPYTLHPAPCTLHSGRWRAQLSTGGRSVSPHFSHTHTLTLTLTLTLTHIPTHTGGTGRCTWARSRRPDRAGTLRRPCLVANRATHPQKCPPSPRNVADSCEVTETTGQDGAPGHVRDALRG